jgi:integrase
MVAGKAKTDALKVKAQVEQRLSTSRGLHDGKTTFGYVVNEWFTYHVLPNLSPTTARDYQSAFEAHMLPQWGGRAIRSIQPREIDRFWAHKCSLPRHDGGVSKTRLNKIRIPLRKMCSWAVAEGYLLESPAKDLKPFKVAKPQMNFLTLEEAERLVVATDAFYRPHMMAFIYTGMRFGELKSMTIDAIALSGVEGAQMHVRHGGIENGEFMLTKTAESDRWIGLPDFLVHELEEHLGRISETPNPLRLAFPSHKGTPLDNAQFRNSVLNPALKRAGLRHLRVHDLRHTFASLLLLNGCDLYTAQRLLGHTDPKTTLRYAHFTKGAASRAALVLHEARERHQQGCAESR